MGKPRYSGQAYISVPVSDIDKSEAWYQRILGLTTLRRLDEPPWCEMATPVDGLIVGLAEVSKINAGDIALTLVVEDLDDARQTLIDAKTAVSEVVEAGDNTRIFSALDPDGNTVMFREG